MSEIIGLDVNGDLFAGCSQKVARKKYQMFGRRPSPNPAASTFLHGNAASNSPSLIHTEDVIMNLSKSNSTSSKDVAHSFSHDIRLNQDAERSYVTDWGCNLTFMTVDEQCPKRRSHSLGSTASRNSSDVESLPEMITASTATLFHERESITRYEKRIRAMNIPSTISLDDIINLPLSDFNDRLKKHALTTEQLSLIRSVRRRGKNKTAAQNCRKRKLDEITALIDDVRHVREKKRHHSAAHGILLAERAEIQKRCHKLYWHIFFRLRDEDGRPYNPEEYCLQMLNNGEIELSE